MSIAVSQLTNEQQSRWEFLTNRVAPRAWWAAMLGVGSVVVGGAALFVGHSDQTIHNVGDIDIWTYANTTQLQSLIEQLGHYLPIGDIEFKTSMVIIKSVVVNVKIVRRSTDHNVEQLLRSMDMDYVQCAIDRSDDQRDVVLVTTSACRDAWQTRHVHWNPAASFWRAHQSDTINGVEWASERIGKAELKGFCTSLQHDYSRQEECPLIRDFGSDLCCYEDFRLDFDQVASIHALTEFSPTTSINLIVPPAVPVAPAPQ